MKKQKTQNIIDPKWNTSVDAPRGKEHLNQDRLRKLKQAKEKAIKGKIHKP